jgi:hypothetical protein
MFTVFGDRPLGGNDSFDEDGASMTALVALFILVYWDLNSGPTP